MVIKEVQNNINQCLEKEFPHSNVKYQTPLSCVGFVTLPKDIFTISGLRQGNCSPSISASDNTSQPLCHIVYLSVFLLSLFSLLLNSHTVGNLSNPYLNSSPASVTVGAGTCGAAFIHCIVLTGLEMCIICTLHVMYTHLFPVLLCFLL